MRGTIQVLRRLLSPGGKLPSHLISTVEQSQQRKKWKNSAWGQLENIRMERVRYATSFPVAPEVARFLRTKFQKKDEIGEFFQTLQEHMVIESVSLIVSSMLDLPKKR